MAPATAATATTAAGGASPTDDQQQEHPGYLRSTTNYVARSADVQGPARVEMRGRSVIEAKAQLRGDLAPIRVGHYCLFDEGCVLRPPVTLRDGVEVHVPMTIGAMTRVGKGAVVEAACVGANVEIGAGAVVSARCVLKDCCRIEPGTVLAPDTVIPPYALVAGVPARIVGELPPSTPHTTRDKAVASYRAVKRRATTAAAAAGGGGGNSGRGKGRGQAAGGAAATALTAATGTG